MQQNHQFFETQQYRTSWLVTTLQDHMQRFGYAVTDLPVIVDADIFLIKAGDKIINDLFTFERNGRQLALRPEFTAAAVYRYIENCQHSSLARWQFSGDVFVDDPLNTNATYQHLAIGAELIGTQDLLADTEIVAMSALGLSALNMDNWEITIGHAGITRQVLATFNLDSITQRILLHQIPALSNPGLGKDYVIDKIDNGLLKSDVSLLGGDDEWIVRLAQMERISSSYIQASGSRTSVDITRRLWQKRKRSTDRPVILEALNFLEKWCEVDGSDSEVFSALIRLLPDNASGLIGLIKQWEAELNNLSAYGIPRSKLRIKPDLARSWEYYTGTVFDLHVSGIHVGGGGRYDEFARLIGSQQDVPAVGFTYYGEQLLQLLPNTKPQTKTISIYLSNDELRSTAIRLSQSLRSKSLTVQVLPGLPSDNDMPTILIENNESVRIQNNIFLITQLEQIISYMKS